MKISLLKQCGGETLPLSAVRVRDLVQVYVANLAVEFILTELMMLHQGA